MILFFCCRKFYKYVYIDVYMDLDKVEKLRVQMDKVGVILNDIGANREVLEKEVKNFGNGGHVVLSKKYVNRKVQVIVD